ncbi:hypothetical protein B0H13DRAFT_2310370 [Mycena leptocephala]|nr:hypothetical protein B0H13DRAFT_2310370 [Mycena leptocephala]
MVSHPANLPPRFALGLESRTFIGSVFLTPWSAIALCPGSQHSLPARAQCQVYILPNFHALPSVPLHHLPVVALAVMLVDVKIRRRVSRGKSSICARRRAADSLTRRTRLVTSLPMTAKLSASTMP